MHEKVARSTFQSQNVQSTPCFGLHFWKLRCRRSVRRCGAKQISKSNMWKAPHARITFGRSDVVSRGRRMGLCTLSKVSKTWGFCSISKNDGRRGTFEEDLQRCIFRGRRSTRDMFIRAVRKVQSADFLRGVAFWSIRSSGLLRWFCVTGAAFRMTQYHFFVAGAVVKTGGVEKSQNALVRGRQLCTQLSIFEGSLAELLRFWCCQLKKWVSLAALLRFWCCQVQQLRKSRWIAAFLMLSSAKIEEVSQNSFVFKLADR